MNNLMTHATLCSVELSDGTPPKWVEIIPAGPRVTGRDGRSWIFGPAEGQSVLSDFTSNGAPLPVDWEHATEYRAPKGEEAPASGWIVQLELRAGALWGKVEWTPRAAAQLRRHEYRFLSPVFAYNKDTGRILKLSSVALTNTPNLHLTALNRVMPDDLINPMQLSDSSLGVCHSLGVDPEDMLKTLDRDVRREKAVEQLTQDQLKICHAFGIDPEDYANNQGEEWTP